MFGSERGLYGLGRVLLGPVLRGYFVGCYKLGSIMDLLIACEDGFRP